MWNKTVSAMSTIRVLQASKQEDLQTLAKIRQPLLLDHLILDEPPETGIVREIIKDVRERGDQAVAEITARVDYATIQPDDVRVPPERIVAARDEIAPELLEAIQHSILQVRRFQESLIRQAIPEVEIPGLKLSLRQRPIGRVGVCVPGAAAPLLSSVVHSALPAQVAGVQEVAVVAPPRHNGDVHPAILAVCAELGIDEVYRMGGAQAIAALALGTERVPRVDKVVGPGGMYVQLAKRYLYGIIDIDMFAATTEVVVIADKTANPRFLAADLLAQAEHNPGCSIMLTDDPELVEPVIAEVEKQLKELSTGQAAAHWLAEFGAIVVVPDLNTAASLAEEIAPEHLQIETANPRELAEQIGSAGAIFIGHFSPESAGDYVAGPSHTLPTGGTARFWSGLSALSFIRGSSMIEYTQDALARDARAIELIGQAEGLEAHARSTTVRVEKQ
jgi:histidinol dehydrogenase